MNKLTAEQIAEIEAQIEVGNELDPALVTKLLSALKAERAEKEAMYDSLTRLMGQNTSAEESTDHIYIDPLTVHL